MERQIGEQFDYKGVKLEVAQAEERYCTGCYFYKNNPCGYLKIKKVTGPCSGVIRKDLKFVIFKQLKRKSATIRKRS